MPTMRSSGHALHRVIACVAIVLVLALGLHAQPCLGNGALGISFEGGGIADEYAVRVHGIPGTTALLGMDTVPGQYPTPAGNLCLGLSPAFAIFPVALDPTGLGKVTGSLPPDPNLVGITLYFQAAAFVPSAPGGLALSPSRPRTVHVPRLFLRVDPGPGSPFQPVTQPFVEGFNALTTASLWTRLRGEIPFMLSSRNEDVVVVAEERTFVVGLEPETGAEIYRQGIYAKDMIFRNLGREVLVLADNGFMRLDTFTGALLSFMPHGIPAPQLANPAERLTELPNSDFVVVNLGTSLELSNVVQGGPPVQLTDALQNSRFDRCVVDGDRMGVLQLGAGAPNFVNLHLYDLNTMAEIPTSPVAIPTQGLNVTGATLAVGNTPNGRGFLVSVAGRNQIHEVSRDGVFGVTANILGDASRLVQSGGGSEWYFPGTNSAAGGIVLQVMDAFTMTPRTVATLPGAVVRDMTVRRTAQYPVGFLATGRQLFAFPTDPFVGLLLFDTFTATSVPGLPANAVRSASVADG